jgi:hypothetical protein
MDPHPGFAAAKCSIVNMIYRICLARLKQLNRKDRKDRKENSFAVFVVQIPAQWLSSAPVLQMAKQRRFIRKIRISGGKQ